MKDRLPLPLAEGAEEAFTERASASPARRVRLVEDASARVTASAALPASLKDVQAWMIGAITGRAADPEREGALLTASAQRTAHERFEVYRYGYRARLVECLLDDYPVIAATLGEDGFEALCHAYVERHPSRSPNLNAFGRHMATFIAEQGEAGAPLADHDAQRAFLAELAALEWSITETIHAAASPPFDFASLATLPVEAWGRARLKPADTVRVLRFEHPVNAYFQVLRTGGTAAVPAPAKSATAVYRRGWKIWRMDLTPAMTRVLVALLDEAPIGEALACMGVDETDPAALAEAERSVMVWFREWVEAGFFCGVSLDS